MRTYVRSVPAVAFLAALAAVPPVAADDDWTVKWSNGHKMESADEQFSLNFGGRIQADYTFVSEDDVLAEAVRGDGFEFRRTRIFFEGTIYERIRFKAQYDFAGGDADFNDMWIGLTTDAGLLQFGHFKEPFSIEGLTSSKYLPFVERALPIEAFWPSRNSGVGFSGGNETVNYGVGAFYDADDFGTSVGEDDLNLTARVAFRPLYEEGGVRLVQVGVSATHKERTNPLRFRTRPEAHFADRFVDTGAFPADGADLLAGEVAAVNGPFWVVAEYVTAGTDAPAVGDPSFDGGYVSAGWYLTGEHRRFNPRSGIFSRPRPNANFGSSGRGSWEIAARYSTIDLTDADVAGGEQDNFAVALNWNLNPATRMMLDGVHADVDGVGEANFIVLRWQVDF